MARAIIGGLAFSTLVSLLVVPALYAYFDTLSAWGRKVMRTARSNGEFTGVTGNSP
jgi:HAE1 family hydrophobic/amphiphilic exporter-1